MKSNLFTVTLLASSIVLFGYGFNSFYAASRMKILKQKLLNIEGNFLQKEKSFSGLPPLLIDSINKKIEAINLEINSILNKKKVERSPIIRRRNNSSIVKNTLPTVKDTLPTVKDSPPVSISKPKIRAITLFPGRKIGFSSKDGRIKFVVYLADVNSKSATFSTDYNKEKKSFSLPVNGKIIVTFDGYNFELNFIRVDKIDPFSAQAGAVVTLQEISQ